MMLLLGLRDDYASDGRVLTEFLRPGALPPALRQDRAAVAALGQAYKQLNASVGEFGANTLAASTAGMRSNAPGDRQYAATMARLTALGLVRDAVAARIAALLDGAEFHQRPIGAGRALAATVAARAVIAASARLAAG